MVSVHRLNLTDTSTFDELYAVYASCHDRDFDQPYAAPEKRVNLTDDAYERHVVVGVHDAGRLVGAGWIRLPQQDNRRFGYVDIFVLPGERRRGIGTRILEDLIVAAREHTRSTLCGEVTWGVDDQELTPGRAFAEGHGFSLDILDAVRELALPARLPTAPVAPGYTVLTWRTCPEEWLDQYADLRRLLVQEAPSGDVGLENEHWDAERVRHEEQQWRVQRRVAQTAAVVAPDESLVGHTQLLFPDESGEVYQWDTLVLPAHRGHGLGLTLKVAAMRAAEDLLAGRRRVSTWNAAENAPMIAVNEAMGYRQTAWGGEYARVLD